MLDATPFWFYDLENMVKKRVAKQKILKRNNRNVVFSYMRNSGPVTIADVSEAIQLSRNTIVKIIEYYENDGFIENIGKGDSTEEGGKKPNLYQFNPLARVACGMELLDGKINIVFTDLRAEIITEYIERLDWNTEVDIILERVRTIYNRFLHSHKIPENKVLGIAFGAHGVVDFTSGKILTSPHNPVWGQNLNFRQQMQKMFPGIPVYLDNRIRFEAFAELVKGDWGEAKDIIVLDVGEGSISGVILNNTLRRGKHFLAGHVGHMVINPEDPEVCDCGGRGCFEMLISTKRLIRNAKEGYKSNPDSMLFEKKKPDEITVDDIFGASNRGDRFAQTLIDTVSRWMALGIHNIGLMYDPDIIVLQGTYAKAGEYLLNRVRKKVNEISLLKVKQPLQIEYSRINDTAGAVGAAAYVISEFSK